MRFRRERYKSSAAIFARLRITPLPCTPPASKETLNTAAKYCVISSRDMTPSPFASKRSKTARAFANKQKNK